MDFALERLHAEDNTRFIFTERNCSYTCGRGKGNDILCLSLLVSRRHCIFIREAENLYVTDLQSSNGIFINGIEIKSHEKINLHENDIIGIGCPEINPHNNETLYVYRVCIVKSSVFNEEDISTLSRTISNNKAPQRSTAISPENPVLNKRHRSSSCDMAVPNKRRNITYNNEQDPNVNVSTSKGKDKSKGINCNLSRDKQSSHNNDTINNNLEIKYDIIDISAEDDIEIIHTSLAKEVKEDRDHNMKSAKCLNDTDKWNFDDKMDISSIENNNDSDVNDRENPNFLHTDDQIITNKNNLQITDDEGPHMVDADTACNKSPIKLKKIKHEPKTRFSTNYDVVDLSDGEEGVFPYSQLFDIKCENNTENKMEIKQEYVSDDASNTEAIGLLNVDDEVIILTDSEDGDNPWLERLSRSQLLNEDIKPVMHDPIVKDEIDLGIWDDEITNIIEQSEMPGTFQIPYIKEISSESRTSVDIKTKTKKDYYSTNLPFTEVSTMDVDEAGPSNDPSTKDINDKNKQKTNAKQSIKLDKQTIENVNKKLVPPTTTKVVTMDVDKTEASNDSNTRDIDKSKRIIDININDKIKRKTYATQKFDKQTIESVKQKSVAPTTEVDAMDVNEAGPSNDSSTRGIDVSKRIVDININDKIKRKTDATQKFDKQTIESVKQKSVALTTEVDAMDVNEAGLNDSSTRDINKSKRIIDININDKIKRKTYATQKFDKQTIESVKQKSVVRTTEVDAMDVNEAGPSNDSSTRDIDKSKRIIDININDKIKRKTDATQKFDKQTIESVKQKSIAPTTEVDAMDVNEAGPSNDSSTRSIDGSKRIVDINIDDTIKRKTDATQKFDKQTIKSVKQKSIAPTTEMDTMDVNEAGPSNDSSTRGIDVSKRIVDININEKIKRKTYATQKFDKQTIESVKQKSVALTTEVDAMDVNEAGPSNDSSTRDIDKSKRIIDININDKIKRKTDATQKFDKQTIENVKQKSVAPTTEVDAMDINEAGPSNDSSTRGIDGKNKQKIDAKQVTEQNRQTIESVKQKLNAKSISKRLIPIIEPLSLPSRKKQSGHNKDKTTEVRGTSRSKLTTKEKISKLKDQLNDEKDRKKKSKSVADNFPLSETKPGPSMSKDEKKKIIEQRKMKLKEIAAEEKKLVAESDQTIRRRNKPRAKISLKNRGDFLITEQELEVSKSLPDKSAELPKSSDQFKKRSTDEANVIKKCATSDKQTEKTNVSMDTVNDIAASMQQSLHLNNMSTASETNTPNFKTTNDNKKKCSSKENTKRSNVKTDPSTKISILQDRTIESASAVQKENFSSNSLKSSMKLKKKKKVSFVDKPVIIEYEIDQHNTLKKLTGKDAPIPTNKLARAPTIYTDWNPKLEEFLLRIFMWNPVWLEEQRHLKREPPIVSESELQSMKLFYHSYKEYYEVAMPLLLCEIWCVMTKDFEMIQKNMQRPTVMCSIVDNSITRTPVPSTNLFLTTLRLEVLVSKEDLNKQTHPVYGDLVYFEYIRNVHGKQNFQKIFAYVTNMQQTIITDFTHYNRDLRNYVKNPYTVITYTLLTRPLEYNIHVNRVQRVRTVTYLRANIRMVQALQFLPHSPLLKLIINPKIEDYQLPPLNGQVTSSSLVTKDALNPKQLEAVFKVTNAVLKNEAKLCFIQGPPGTGKSKVIVNLVTQILFGEHQENKPTRILVCAPSNAAIDELVLRLLNIRSILKQKRFNMVRIGRLESMHPMTKCISVTELARRFLISLTKSQKPTSSGNVEELAFLKARINSLESELESIQNKHEAKRTSLMNKLNDLLMRYELKKSGKSIDEINPKDRAKYQRTFENTILRGANVIACTLSSCYTNQMESIFGGHKESISVCIVDEATQSCEAETLIPLMLGVNTLILVGDPNQLPATVLSQQAKKLGLDQSVFSRIQNAFKSQSNSPIMMLNTQYRMEYSISYWPNKYFYNGKLQNAVEYRKTFPFHPYRVLTHNFVQNDDKFSNTTEAEFVANIIFSMLIFAKWEESSSTAISIGILTPYNNQRALVLNKINEKISFLPDHLKQKIIFEVNTVDGFQGQERDVIIMSCVRSSGIGFLSDKQRLCVALTRAKHSLILCGNFNTFKRDIMWKALIHDARDRGILCHIDAKATPAMIKRFIIK